MESSNIIFATFLLHPLQDAEIIILSIFFIIMELIAPTHSFHLSKLSNLNHISIVRTRMYDILCNLAKLYVIEKNNQMKTHAYNENNKLLLLP